MKTSRFVGQFIVLAVVLGLFFAVTRRFLIPVLIGFLTAIVVTPLYVRLLKRIGNRRKLSAAILTFLVTVCVIVPFVLIGVVVVQEAESLVSSLQNTPPGTTVSEFPPLKNALDKMQRFLPVSEKQIVAGTKEALNAAGRFGGHVLGLGLAAVPGKLLSAVFFLIALYYGLTDGPKFVRFLFSNAPFTSNQANQLSFVVVKTCEAVVLGALLSGIAHGLLIGFAYWIFDIPRPLLFGVITGILSFVPMIGSIPTAWGGVIYLLIDGRYGAAIGMTVAATITGISDNVLKPWVLKGKVELHPLLGLISALGGAEVFGFSGLFLGPLIAALTIELIKMAPLKRPQQENPQPDTEP